MGGEASKEVRLVVSPDAANEAAGLASRDAAEVERHQAHVQQLEESLFKSGYKHGRDDALSSLEDEIKRTARTAYAQLVLEEEARRAAELGAAVTQLERVRPRTAAARAGECVAEEDAVVACTPDGGNEYCAAPVRAYVLCADRVLFRMMNPISAAAAAAAKQDK